MYISKLCTQNPITIPKFNLFLRRLDLACYCTTRCVVRFSWNHTFDLRRITLVIYHIKWVQITTPLYTDQRACSFVGHKIGEQQVGNEHFMSEFCFYEVNQRLSVRKFIKVFQNTLKFLVNEE